MATATLRDPYEVLELPRSATAEQVNKAYRRLSKKYHSDRNPGDQEADAKYKEVQAAHDVLGQIADPVTSPKGLPYLRTVHEEFSLLSREGLLEYGRALVEDQKLLLKQHQTPLVKECLDKIAKLIVEVPYLLDTFFPAEGPG